MGPRILRFTRTERALHWLTTLAFFSMLGSGLLIGRSGGFHQVMYAWHLASAGVLVAGIALLFWRGNRSALRRTVRDLRGLDGIDRAWLESVPPHITRGAAQPPAGRFNAGQKVNFLLTTLLLVVLFGSGIETIVVGRHHNLIFGLHKVATIAAAGLVAGHLYMALVNRGARPALRGMVTGDVDWAWAREHHSRWVEALETGPPYGSPGPAPQRTAPPAGDSEPPATLTPQWPSPPTSSATETTSRSTEPSSRSSSSSM